MDESFQTDKTLRISLKDLVGKTVESIQRDPDDGYRVHIKFKGGLMLYISLKDTFDKDGFYLEELF